MSKVKLQKPIFDPRKDYQWEPTDIFEISLTGQQFASLYHLVNQEMHTSGGAPLHFKVEVHALVMDLFKDLVAEGIINERKAEVTPAEEDNVKQLFKS